ncbi:MAG: hypothetical protein RQ866_04025 [Bacteroidales bacterium]|nr:hypothetical protein [Bacteroidales bacterium]
MKKQKFTRTLLYFLMATFMLSGFYGCKKYEEGPFISLLTKKARIDNTWDLIQAYNDDVDILDQVKIGEYEWRIDKNGSFVLINNSNTITGSWEFVSDKEELKLMYDLSPTPSIWTIVQLKNNKMTLSRIKQDNTQEIYYYETKK